MIRTTAEKLSYYELDKKRGRGSSHEGTNAHGHVPFVGGGIVYIASRPLLFSIRPCFRADCRTYTGLSPQKVCAYFGYRSKTNLGTAPWEDKFCKTVRVG